MARDDFARLRQEYRERHSHKPEWAADFMFKSLTVAKDCISDDAWFSRQAQEKYAGATTHHQAILTIQLELSAFLQRHVEVKLADLPKPREAS